jgi:hypothetical protein
MMNIQHLQIHTTTYFLVFLHQSLQALKTASTSSDHESGLGTRQPGTHW